MTQAERDLGRRWFEQVWNEGRREAIAEMYAADGVLHDGEVTTQGPGAFYDFFDRMMATFSDLHLQIEDTLEQDNKLCVRWSCTAKHTGQGLGVEPTRKQLHVTGISILRIAGGQIVEAWQNWDMLGLIEQIQGGRRSPTYIAEPSAAVAG